jgi:hypothetical protein
MLDQKLIDSSELITGNMSQSGREPRSRLIETALGISPSQE